MISTMPVATVKNSSNGCANVINACCYYYHCSDGPNCAHGYNDYHLFAIVLFCNSDIYIYIYIYIHIYICSARTSGWNLACLICITIPMAIDVEELLTALLQIIMST
jgi:hypothetical protein